MRFRTILSQFQAAVDRVDDKRTTWSAMTVALWQQGLKPNVRCLMLNDKPVTSLKDAIDSARRHEDTGLAGGHISTLYQQVPHRALGRFASHPSPQSRAGRGRADLFQGKVALLATVWEPSPSSMYSPDFVQEQPHDRAVLHPPSGST